MNELIASPGESIFQKWAALRSWVNRQKHQAPGAAINYGPRGATIIFDQDEYSVNVYLRVSLIGNKAIVGDGTVNGKTPTINGIPVTGTQTPPVPPPQISVANPDNDGNSMICVKTTHNARLEMTQAEIVSLNPSALPNGMRADYAASGHGFIPIAIIRHDPATREPSSVFQHSVHNLQCRMYLSSGGYRLVYWAA